MSSVHLDVDLADADTYLQGTPHHLFKQLRTLEPVSWNPRTDGGPGIWNITKYDDVAAIGRDWQRFTSTRGVSINRMPAEEEARAAETLLVFMDPPRHTRLRNVVNLTFTPKRIAALQSVIEYHASCAIDRVIEQGHCNFFDIAADLPIRMISELLGIPDEDHKQVLDWTNRTFGHEDPEYSTGPEDYGKALEEIFAYGMALIGDRRKNPRDDLTSAIANAKIDGDPISDMELMFLFFLFLGAGNDTTRTLILQGVRLFAQNPHIWRTLRQDRSLLPNAIEEIVRLEPSGRGMGRMATEDVQLRDKTIKAGEQVYLWYVASNRDEEKFEDADTFRLDRPSMPKHQGFGGGGPHLCAGAPLARLQSRLFFNQMLDRIPEFQLSGDIVWARSIQFNTMKVLPISFAPGARLNATRPEKN
jgi:cholest-4-en-3-one 26-monooxygenase